MQIELPRLTISVAMMVGVSLLILLPVSRFARLQVLTGLFLLALAADAWFTTFGEAAFGPLFAPLFRYPCEYGMLLAAAWFLNALAGWRSFDAWVAGGCWASLSAALFASWMLGAVTTLVPWLDCVGMMLILGYSMLVAMRLWFIAPGPAMRMLSVLLLGIASALFDIVVHLRNLDVVVGASVLSPLFLIGGLLGELAIQGHRLNRAADRAQSDLERQLLEQDAVLLRSSQLLRHHERWLAASVERQRLLRDMHDGAGGMLAHLLVEVRGRALTYPQIECELEAVLDDLLSIRAACDAADEAIDVALAMLCQRVRPRLERASIELDYRSELPTPAPILPAPALLNLYRLLQEGFANCLRHAHARHVTLSVGMSQSADLRIVLTDDGRGFVLDTRRTSDGGGRGLSNMHRRAEQMGASLQLKAAMGQGVQLDLIVPLPKA